MQVNLNQNDIVQALKNHIGGQGISVDNKDVKMAFKAGRKGSGLSVLVTIDNAANGAGQTTAFLGKATTVGVKEDVARQAKAQVLAAQDGPTGGTPSAVDTNAVTTTTKADPDAVTVGEAADEILADRSEVLVEDPAPIQPDTPAAKTTSLFN